MRVITESGREFEFQEFCSYMARIYEFLGTRPGYELVKYSRMEGMETSWQLTEVRGRSRETIGQLGPTLYYSNTRNIWCGVHTSPDMPLNFVDDSKSS